VYLIVLQPEMNPLIYVSIYMHSGHAGRAVVPIDLDACVRKVRCITWVRGNKTVGCYFRNQDAK